MRVALAILILITAEFAFSEERESPPRYLCFAETDGQEDFEFSHCNLVPATSFVGEFDREIESAQEMQASGRLVPLGKDHTEFWHLSPGTKFAIETAATDPEETDGSPTALQPKRSFPVNLNRVQIRSKARLAAFLPLAKSLHPPSLLLQGIDRVHPSFLDRAHPSTNQPIR